MTNETLIFAIGEIEDSYILSAGNKLNKKRKSRKAIICIAAVIALMLSTFVTAMAVNEDFRESVLRIFNISETEEVQHSGTVIIGDVNASYMALDNRYILRNGLIYNAQEEVFCRFSGGGLTKLETSINSLDFQFGGETLKLHYAYTVLGGQLHAVEISQDNIDKNPLMYSWSITPLRGSEDKAWLTTFKEIDGYYSAYPLLLDVKTGDTVDILQGIDLHGTACDAWFFSPNNRYAVIRTDGDDRLIDVENKTVTELKDCHESYFLSDGSLLCFVSREEGFNLVRRNPENGEETTLLHNAQFSWKTADGSGYMNIDYYGGAGNHALLIDDSGSITLLDLRDGSRLLLDGITKEDEETFRTIESADGEQILIAVKAQESSGSFSRLGIIDCKNGTLKIFDRNNMLDNCGENLFGFTADGSIGIIGTSEKGQWLYVYDFGNTEHLSELQPATAVTPSDEELVLVKDYIPDIYIDLKYATTNNFTGTVIYESDDAYLRYGTVKKLAEVQNELRNLGYSLKIWDAYRPTSAQYKLWEVCPNPEYVANPNNGYSNHSRGNTVDVTIVHADGSAVTMPSDFDDFSVLADRDYRDVSAEAAKNATLLESAMLSNGFSAYSGEWWHYSDTVSYPVV